MIERKSIPVPYVTLIFGAMLTLITGGIFWLVSTTNEVPAMKRDLASLKEDMQEAKQDIREIRASAYRSRTR
jgi:hypothetical protein